MQAADISLNAAAFMDSTDSIVATAGRLADELVRHLRDGHSVHISMSGMRGVASSYFNVILQRITKDLGIKALDRIHFQWDSAAQQVVYQRSLKSLMASNPC